jgi:hypothetical protein
MRHLGYTSSPVPFWRSLPRPQRVAVVVVFVALGAIGFLPLFGGPGYEQSLASGLVVPSAAAIATALELSASDFDPFAGVRCGLASGGRLAVVAFATALLHGLRAGMCDLAGGAWLFLFTAGVGSLMGGAWGAAVAEACRRRKARRLACVLLAVAGPLAGIAVSVARFYSSPMIFAYDPFFGFFSGALYDTIVDIRAQLWTYRAGSLATLTGVVLVALVLRRTDAGALALRPLRPDRLLFRLVPGLAAFGASLLLAANGPALGHWQTARSIAQALIGRAAGEHCDVVYSESLRAEQVALLVRDCEQQLAADQGRLGTHLEGRLTEYVFRDANEKRLLMGAAQTSIAKPWRREVYVQMSSYPHPILGHEIAHVVAGSFGRGPFRVAGGVGGLWPNPGLIEGVAVATSPDDDELTDAQWARAMLELGILPPVRQLFSLSFLGENSAKSYTIAGAFVAWVQGRWGASAVRAWYGGASIEEMTGLGWDALDEQFRQSLQALTMPPEASAYARAKFDRPSVWARKCPHVVDVLDRDGDRCRDEHRFDHATVYYNRALERDLHDWHARFERARIDLWNGREAQGRDELETIVEDDRAPRTWRDRAREALADDDLSRGRNERAKAIYRELATHSLDEDAVRTLEVKALSVDDPPARRAILDLLIGDPGRSADSWLGALSLGTWAEATHDALAAYLVGKNLAVRDEHRRATTWLDGALAVGVPTESVARELLRQRAICACALQDAPALQRVTESIDEQASPFAQSVGGGRKRWVQNLIARCGAPLP